MRSSRVSVAQASAKALAKEGPFMLRRRTVVSLCAVLLLSLAAPTVALAQLAGVSEAGLRQLVGHPSTKNARRAS
jgi:hypothetical protein